MKIRPAELEHHIAVLGESGSGKTVMLSSFYGAAQEPDFLQSNLFHIVADDTTLGNQLHRNYLGMRDSARKPETTRFLSTSYAFSVKLKEGESRAKAGKHFDALRLVWHDYPGDWFEQGVSGSEEAHRRVDTFRALLVSDVALLLVDGQKLLDNAGEEERYLKSLMGNFRNGMLRLKDELLEDGKPLVQFPRIWILALSKADLLPDYDVFKFRDLLIEKVSPELGELRTVVAGFVESPDALAVGEDFLLLSSAKFETNNIEVDKRVGLDLVIPLAAMVPFDRHVRWAEQKLASQRVRTELLTGAGDLAAVMIGNSLSRTKGIKFAQAAKFLGPRVEAFLSAASNLAGDRLAERNSEALSKKDYMAAALTRFQMDLAQNEDDRVLLRSRK